METVGAGSRPLFQVVAFCEPWCLGRPRPTRARHWLVGRSLCARWYPALQSVSILSASSRNRRKLTFFKGEESSLKVKWKGNDVYARRGVERSQG